MSRRNRHKKKKQQKLRRSIMSESQPQASGKVSHSVSVVKAPDEDIEAAPEIVDVKEVQDKKPPEEIEQSESIIDAPTRKLIGKDVRMIIFTLLGLAIILTAVKILSLKTGYVDSFGSWLYKITNIQTM